MDITEPSDSRPIRRSDLNLLDSLHSPSRSPSPSPSPSAQAKIQARLAALYGPVSDPHTHPQPGGSPVPTTLTPAQRDTQEDSDAGYEFRLFAAAPSTRPQESFSVPQEAPKPPEKHSRIRIESPSPAADAGGFVNPHRPAGYYFAGETPARAAEFALAAVDGNAVLREAQRVWPGNKLPWRVQFLPRSQFRGVPVFESQGEVGAGQWLAQREGSNKRKPGKKRRIILRKRAKRKGEEKLKKVKDLEEKEKEEREKRTRRNREKKVKRKEREKRKQAEKKEDGAGSGAEIK